MRDHRGQRNASCQFLCRALVEFELLPHHDLKPSLSVADDAKHLLVRTAGQERFVDDNRMPRRLGFAANAIESTRALLQRARIPAKVMMQNVAAETVQVDPP